MAAESWWTPPAAGRRAFVAAAMGGGVSGLDRRLRRALKAIMMPLPGWAGFPSKGGHRKTFCSADPAGPYPASQDRKGAAHSGRPSTAS